MTSLLTGRKATRALLLIAILAAGSLLTACGAGAGTSNAANDTNSPDVQQEKGEVMISLTDAEGDFLNYQVDVTQLTLTHSNGATLSVMPATTQVDFAQYVDTSELLSISSVPRGRYDSATITLDFSQAHIVVQDETGNPVVADAVDNDGAALGEVTVNLNFRDGERFVVTRGLLSHITLDFDLNASNQIEFMEDTALVTVNPVLIADTLHNHSKPTRLRGLIDNVGLNEQKIALSVRPFHQRLVHFGDADVYVDNNTLYNIDGLPVDTQSGLQVLSELPESSAMVAIGSWHMLQRRYIANEIYAGSSVPWDGEDFIKGTVVARYQNQITLRGAVLEQDNGQVTLNDTYTLQISDNAKVSRKQELVSTAEISVGSRIFASGSAISEELFEVGDGFVRIRPSMLTGEITDVNPLTLNLQLLNARRLELFDFSGTGTTPENNAAPDNYEVDPQTLMLSGLEPGDLIKVAGYSKSYGAAPADFVAETIIDVSNIEAFMVIEYDYPGTNEALAFGDNGIGININEADRKHHLFRAASALDLQTLDTAPIMTAAQGGIFTIVEGRTINIYRHYSEFSANLNSRLQNGERIRKVQALGIYSDNSNQISGRHIRVVLSDD